MTTGGISRQPGAVPSEKWKLMPRWELIAWASFFIAQPFPMVFWLADALQDAGAATGRPWLPWVVAVFDALLIGLAAWRFRVTRRPPIHQAATRVGTSLSRPLFGTTERIAA